MKHHCRLFAGPYDSAIHEKVGSRQGKEGKRGREGKEHMHRSDARETIAKASRANVPSVLKTFSALLSS